MIRFSHKGDFSKVTRFLERAKEVVHLGDLDKYGREGVAALASATPVDSGLTASSWYYEIVNRNLQRSPFTTQIFKMGFRSRSSCNMVTEPVTEAGYRGEIISILLSSLFLTKSQTKHGRRLRSYE